MTVVYNESYTFGHGFRELYSCSSAESGESSVDSGEKECQTSWKREIDTKIVKKLCFMVERKS